MNVLLSESKQSSEFFKLKELDGDKNISLGQTILALITLNKSIAYTEEQNKYFTTELIASLILELGITPKDLFIAIQNRE